MELDPGLKWQHMKAIWSEFDPDLDPQPYWVRPGSVG